MASVRFRKGSQFWSAVVRRPGEKPRHFSTGLTDKAEALAVAVAAERQLRKHAEKPHQLRAALSRLADDFVPVAAESPALWLEKWAAARSGEVAPATAASYVSAAGAASEWMLANGVRAFTDLTKAKLTEMRDHWGAEVSPATANYRIKCLRIALGDAVRHGFLKENTATEVPKLRVEKSARRKFTEGELRALLATLSGEWRAITLLGLYTGQRINDLATLQWSAIDLKKQTISFQAGKTGSLVALPLLPSPLAALQELAKEKKPADFVLPKIQAMPAPSRSKAFRKALARVGLAKKVHHKNEKRRAGAGSREVSELSFHSLRHTATSALKSAGVSDAIARAIVGHESAAVSREYTKFDLSTMREAMQKMPVL